MLQRPDLIRIDLFLLNPNVSTVDPSQPIDELHRVRLFSGRMEVSKAFSPEHQLHSDQVDENTLLSSFGTSLGISVAQFVHEIPLYVASPNKANPQELIQHHMVSSRSPVRTSAATVTSSAAPPPKKPIMVGIVSLRVELVQEACLGRPINDLRVQWEPKEQLRCEDREGGDDEILPSLLFVSSVLDDLGTYPTADGIYNDNNIFASIEMMDSTSALECIEHCAVRQQVLQDEQARMSNSINKKMLEGQARLLRLSEKLLYRLSSDKELIDDEALVATVKKLESSNSYALLWDYFQYWLTTPLSQLLVGHEKVTAITTWSAVALTVQDWRSVRTACYSLRLLHHVFASRLKAASSDAVDDPPVDTNTLENNINLLKSLSTMAKELLHSLYEYGHLKFQSLQEEGTRVYEASWPVISATSPDHEDHTSGPLIIKNKLESEYCRLINAEVDSFADAGETTVNGETDSANNPGRSGPLGGGGNNFASLVTAKVMATKMAKQQRNRKALKFYSELSGKLGESACTAKAILDNILSSSSLLLSVANMPSGAEEPSASFSQEGSMKLQADFPTEILLRLVKSCALLFSDCITRVIPPSALVEDDRVKNAEQLGALIYFDIRQKAQESTALLISYCNHLFISCPFVLNSLDFSRDFLLTRRRWDTTDYSWLGETGVNAVAVVTTVIQFIRQHLLHLDGNNGNVFDGNSIISSLGFEVQLQQLKIVLYSFICNIIKLLSEQLSAFELVVPTVISQAETFHLPPTSIRRNRSSRMSDTIHVGDEAYPSGPPRSTGKEYQTQNQKLELDVSGGLEHSFAMLSTMGSTIAAVNPHTPQRSQQPAGRGTPNFKEAPESGTTAGGPSTLAYLRSLQLEQEKRAEPVMTKVRGGPHAGTEAVLYLGKKFEVLQTLQFCVDTFIQLCKRLNNARVGEIAGVPSSKMENNRLSLHVLKMCRYFVHETIMNAVMKGMHNENKSFQEEFEALASTVPAAESRCFIQLLTFISCCTCTWWHYWFDLACFHFHALKDLMPLDDLMLTLTDDSRFLTQSSVAALFRVSYDEGLGIDEMGEYLAYILEASDRKYHSDLAALDNKLDSCGPISEWLRLRGSLLASIAAIIKFQLLFSDKILVLIGYKFSCIGQTETPRTKDTRSSFPENYVSISKALKIVSKELPHSISLLQDLSSLEPLVDLRPDVVLLCLDFDYDALDAYYQSGEGLAKPISENTSGARSHPGFQNSHSIPGRAASDGIFYYLYASKADWRAQRLCQHDNVHNFDAISSLSLLLELSSLVPVLEASFSELFVDSDAFTAAALPELNFEVRSLFDIKSTVGPISSCRYSLLLSCLYLLKIFAPGQESTDLDTISKAQALEGTFLAMIDRFILGSLPLSDPHSATRIQTLLPIIYDVLNFSYKDTSSITATQFYSSKRCSAVVTAILHVLSSFQFDSHWFSRLDDMRHHLAHKCSALHQLVCNKLYCMELEDERLLASNAFELLQNMSNNTSSKSMKSASSATAATSKSLSKRLLAGVVSTQLKGSYGPDVDSLSVGTTETSETTETTDTEGGIASLLDQLAIAIRRRQGPPLRMEDKLGVKLVLGPPQYLDTYLNSVHKTVFFALRRRFANLSESATISELIHEQGFGHGIYCKPYSVSAANSNNAFLPRQQQTRQQQFMDKSQIKRLTYATRTRFWKSMSIQNLIAKLQMLTLYRVDLKQRTDVRLLGSETCFNSLLVDLASIPGLAHDMTARIIEVRRRLLDSYSSISVDPIERFGNGGLGSLFVAKLALHFSIVALLSDDRSLFLTTAHQASTTVTTGARRTTSVDNGDTEYKSHTNYEHVLEHGGQVAREMIKALLRDGEWEMCSDILSELSTFYRLSSSECVSEAQLLSRVSSTELLRLTSVVSGAVAAAASKDGQSTSLLYEEMHKFGIDVTQLSETRRLQRHEYCLDHYRRNVALAEEMSRAKDKVTDRRRNDAEIRPFPIYYAARIFPNPFVPSGTRDESSVRGAGGKREAFLDQIQPFLECTALPSSLTVPAHHRQLIEEEDEFYELHEEDITENSGDDDIVVVGGHMEKEADIPHHKQYLDAELFLDPVDSLGIDRAVWVLFRVDPTAHIASSELYQSIAVNERRAREKGDILQHEDRLPVILPPPAYHSLEAQLCQTFPEYRVVSPDTHQEIGSNVASGDHGGAYGSASGAGPQQRYLDRTIQLFEAFPQVLCEDSSLANELLEKADAHDGSDGTDASEGEFSSPYGSQQDILARLPIQRLNKRLSVATKQSTPNRTDEEDDEYVAPDDDDVIHGRRIKKIWEQAMQSRHFYIFAYENPACPFVSLLNQRRPVTESTMDPVRVTSDFEDEYGPRLLRYTLVTSGFNVDRPVHQNIHNNEDQEKIEGEEDEEYGFRVVNGVSAPQGQTSSHSVYPAMDALLNSSWVSPCLYARIDCVRRMDAVSACSQICNAQLILSQRIITSMQATTLLSHQELLQNIPAGDLATGGSVMVHGLAVLSNMCVEPSSCVVGLHSAKILVSWNCAFSWHC
jgi:hypothetical protein